MPEHMVCKLYQANLSPHTHAQPPPNPFLNTFNPFVSKNGNPSKKVTAIGVLDHVLYPSEFEDATIPAGRHAVSAISSTPSSSSSRPPSPQYPLPLTQAYLYHTYRPGSLLLLPCTIDQYFELPFLNDDKYELVQGFLWWKGEMLMTHPHDETRGRIAAEFSRRYMEEGY